jgi:hypothetical protein
MEPCFSVSNGAFRSMGKVLQKARGVIISHVSTALSEGLRARRGSQPFMFCFFGHFLVRCSALRKPPLLDG